MNSRLAALNITYEKGVKKGSVLEAMMAATGMRSHTVLCLLITVFRRNHPNRPCDWVGHVTGDITTKEVGLSAQSEDFLSFWLAVFQGRFRPTLDLFPVLVGTPLEPMLRANVNLWESQRSNRGVSSGSGVPAVGMDVDQPVDNPSPRSNAPARPDVAAALAPQASLGNPALPVNPVPPANPAPPANYHGAHKYCGPPMNIVVLGGGEDPQTIQNDDGKVECSLCGDMQASQALLNRHFVKHRVGTLECPFGWRPPGRTPTCSPHMVFYRWDKFNDHIKRHHPEVNQDDPTRIHVYEQYLKRGERPQHSKLAQNLKGEKRRQR
ncbi:hypothetical protein BZA05DRAFT_416737 [Tricharina praecox]|uniref:uncharacterized protein n=1 Tax=Tricharina praecox TaxID=43433 RepID=UPI0022208008|nr:uncharacterized protein BZA05DRAFT_416737 [Tricharina praecox]KAI5855144.1 hypothetical protein BZA05DRAFT_416737 [Tricharina praecox]